MDIFWLHIYIFEKKFKESLDENEHENAIKKCLRENVSIWNQRYSTSYLNVSEIRAASL